MRVLVLLAAGVAGTYLLFVLAVRKRWAFAGIGALLVAWGAWVYAPENAGREWTWQEGWNEGSAAANKAVSAFFPSRGDYDAPGISAERGVSPGRGYWAFHTLAILYMLSLAVAVFGVELVNRWLVAWLGRCPFQLRPRPVWGRRELNVVWGLGEEGRRLADGLAAVAGKSSVVFALEEDGGGWFDLEEAGGALRGLTREGWTWVLGRAGKPGALCLARRHFFLGPDGCANAARAETLMKSLGKRRRGGQVTIHVRTWTDADDDAVHAWVDMWNRRMNGTGVQVQVEAVREESVVARKFLLDHPMLEVPGVEVDTENTAVAGRFRVLVAGFGALGRRLVSEMVADAQFLGADGKPVPLEVDVADRDGASWGWFQTECAEACRRYRIEFHENDVRAAKFWSWLEERPAYNRVVLATLDDDVNLEAAGRVANAYKARFPEMRGRTGQVVFARVRSHALAAALRGAVDAYGLFGDTAETYEPGVLLHGRWNDGAVRVNGIWAGTPDGKTGREEWNRAKWAGTSTFDRESSRASFFHQRNLLRLAGFKVFDGARTDGELDAEKLVRVGEQRVKEKLLAKGRLEKLSEMEHMRWMAFHLVRGWRRWSPTKAELEALVQKHGKPPKPNALKRNENGKTPLHADLADYRDLAEVDRLFNEVNHAHGWKDQDVDSAKKDKDLVYGVEALFGAGFTVAEPRSGTQGDKTEK